MTLYTFMPDFCIYFAIILVWYLLLVNVVTDVAKF